MKKVLAVTIISLFVTSLAFADTPTDKAIGYDGGLSLRMNLDSGISVQGIIGLGLLSPKSDKKDSDFDLTIGGNVFKCLWEDDKANLNMFAGIEIDLDGTTTKDVDSNTDFMIVVGLEPEVFLSECLSVSTKMGVGITFAGNRSGVDNTGWTDISTFGDVLGSAALHWYF